MKEGVIWQTWVLWRCVYGGTWTNSRDVLDGAGPQCTDSMHQINSQETASMHRWTAVMFVGPVIHPDLALRDSARTKTNENGRTTEPYSPYTKDHGTRNEDHDACRPLRRTKYNTYHLPHEHEHHPNCGSCSWCCMNEISPEVFMALGQARKTFQRPEEYAGVLRNALKGTSCYSQNSGLRF